MSENNKRRAVQTQGRRQSAVQTRKNFFQVRMSSQIAAAG